MNFNKFEVYGNPTLQQGGWERMGEGNAYVEYNDTTYPSYAYRICTLDYIPQHHPTQISITGIASKELEVSVLVLRSDNYIIAALGWHDNGYAFNLGSTYDKLGVMFRFKNGNAIAPNQVSFDIVGDWTNIPHYIHNTSTDTLTTLPADIYANDTTATVGLKGDMSQTGTPSPTTPIQPSECGDLETTGEHTGQYKIPILSNSTTTNVYLGEVQTTRNIKKLVLTGDEDWALSSSYAGGFYLATINPDYMRDDNSNLAISTHYITDNQTASIGNVNQGHMSFSYTTTQRLYIRDTNYATTDAFKTYLQQQYANGTPVCVWYVLATPETAVVNEPLRKIGTYADSVSGITIPVTAGANTLSIGTTLQPSEVTATYKGWHPVQSVHEYESGQWD